MALCIYRTGTSFFALFQTGKQNFIPHSLGTLCLYIQKRKEGKEGHFSLSLIIYLLHICIPSYIPFLHPTLPLACRWVEAGWWGTVGACPCLPHPFPPLSLISPHLISSLTFAFPSYPHLFFPLFLPWSRSVWNFILISSYPPHPPSPWSRRHLPAAAPLPATCTSREEKEAEFLVVGFS